MTTTAIPDDKEVIRTCPCCGMSVFSACGGIVIDGEEVAGYWYRWSEGHEGRFEIALAWVNDEAYVATAWGHTSVEGIQYGVNEVDDSPWGDMSEYGTHLGRQSLLNLPAERGKFFELADTLAVHEPNLSKRIKGRYALV